CARSLGTAYGSSWLNW
nr:immunoglobulin heavy chain junction region [Mus musculus]